MMHSIQSEVREASTTSFLFGGNPLINGEGNLQFRDMQWPPNGSFTNYNTGATWVEIDNSGQ